MEVFMRGKILDFMYVFLVGILLSGSILISFIIFYPIEKLKIYDEKVLVASKNKKLMDETYNKLIYLFDSNQKYDFIDVTYIKISNPIYKKLKLDWNKLFNLSYFPEELRVRMIYKKKYKNKKLIKNKVTIETIDKIEICHKSNCYLFNINNNANDMINTNPYQLSITWRDETLVKIK